MQTVSNIKITGTRESIVYALSMLSNLNSNYPAKTQNHLYDQAKKVQEVFDNQTFRNFAGTWEVVWGPGLFNEEVIPSKNDNPRWVSHNAMYMAKNIDADEYFIGVAGTNGISALDWFKEDFDVSTMVAWPPKYLASGIPSTQAKISEGTNLGLNILWKMKGSYEKEATLIDYIREILTNPELNDCTISVGGHSLGGCLAPVLGTAIVDALEYGDSKNKTELLKKVSVVAYPTAGPTPGNQAFANHIGNSVDYYAIINQNDVVPLAWDFKGLRELKGAYNNVVFGGVKLTPNIGIVRNFLRWAQSLPGTNSYARNPEQSRASKKTFEVKEWRQAVYTVFDKDKPDDTKQAITKFSGIFLNPRFSINIKELKGKYEGHPRLQLAAFFLQLGAQHVAAYSSDQKVPNSSGLIIPKEVAKLMSDQYFDLNSLKNWKEALWVLAQLVDELVELTGKAAKWVKEHPESEDIGEVVYEAGRNQHEREEMEKELSEVEMESILKELGENITDLPFFQKPIV